MWHIHSSIFKCIFTFYAIYSIMFALRIALKEETAVADEDEMVQELLLDMILKNAITFEEDSRDFYLAAAEKAVNQDVVDLLKSFAVREMEHVERLNALKESDIDETLKNVPAAPIRAVQQTGGLHIAINPEDDMHRVFKVAIEREQRSFSFYSTLHARSNHPKIKKLFYALAKEENEHKEDLMQAYKNMCG